MEKKDMRQFYAQKNQMQKKLSQNYPALKNECGIYMFYRVVAYIGKSSEKDGILGRCASHCIQHQQHIDKSIHTRKLSCDGGQWYIKPLVYCNENEIDKYEKEFIDKYKNGGYELYNIESGGTDGKTLIADRKETKGYVKGLHKGYKNAQKDVSHWFDLHLDYSIKGKPNKNKEKALEKFGSFLKGEK